MQAEHFADKLHQFGVAGVSKLLIFARLSEEVELQVLEMGLGHVDLGLVEEVVVLDLDGGGRGVVVCHGRMDQVADTGLKGAVENVQVQEVFRSARLVLGGQGSLHVVQVSEWEFEPLIASDFLDELHEEAGGLTHHDVVLTLVGGNWGNVSKELGEASVRLVTSTSTSATSLFNIQDTLVGEKSLEA